MMKLKKKGVYIAFVIILLINSIPLVGQNTKLKVNEISHGKFECVLETMYIEDTDAYLIVKQYIVFKKDGDIIRKREIPTFKSKKTNSNNITIDVVDNMVYGIGIIKGKNEFIIYVEGNGGNCSSCSEFYGFYNMEGKLICYEYSKEIIKPYLWSAQINKYNDMLKKYGIMTREIEMFKVFPYDIIDKKYKTNFIKFGK